MSDVDIEKLLRARIKEEYSKCATDFVYAVKKHFTIAHPLHGKLKFNLYPFQETTLQTFIDNKYVIINKGRQLGISTLVAAYALWKMIFNPNYSVLVIATTQDVAKAIVEKVQLMYDNLPSWLKPRQIVFNKLTLKLENGSTIVAVSSSEKSARSHAVSLLVIDEAAFIDKFDNIWLASQATLATGGNSIVLSSPNGVGNLFHRMCVEAQEGSFSESNKPFFYVELPWYLHPERDARWADVQRAKLGARGFAQEHACDFISSGHTLIEGEILKWYLDNMCEDPLDKRYPFDAYWLWEYPNYNRSYMVVADVARGDGRDDSAFHVIDIESLTQVASFKGKIDTTEFGHLLVNVATEWNNALLVIDNKGIGWDVVQVALDRDYPNLYYSYRNDPFFDKNIHIMKNYDLKSKSNMVPGFTTTTKLRLNIISKIETYVKEKQVILKCRRTVNELFTFMWIDGKVQAQQGYNDDMSMALGMGLFVRDTSLRLKMMGVDMTRNAVSNIHKTIYRGGTQNRNPYNYPTQHGNEDISWVVRKK